MKRGLAIAVLGASLVVIMGLLGERYVVRPRLGGSVPRAQAIDDGLAIWPTDTLEEAKAECPSPFMPSWRHSAENTAAHYAQELLGIDDPRRVDSGRVAPPFTYVDIYAKGVRATYAEGHNPRVEEASFDIDKLPRVIGRSDPDDALAGSTVDLVGDVVGEELSFRYLETLPFATDVWTVQTTHREGDQVRLELGNVSVQDKHLHLRTSHAEAERVQNGDRLIGVQELLYRERRIFGADFTVGFLPNVEQEPIEIPVKLPLLRLHCPKHDGCASCLEYAEARGGKVDASILFFGIEAKQGYFIKARVSRTWSVGDQTCLQVAVPGSLRLEFGTTCANDLPVSYGLRATVVAVSDDPVEHTPIPDNLDTCQRPTTEIPDKLRLGESLRIGHGLQSQTVAYEAEKHVSGRIGVDLEIGAVPVKLAVGFTRSTESKSVLTTTLAPGAQYLNYTPFGPISAGQVAEVCWTSLPVEASAGQQV